LILDQSFNERVEKARAIGRYRPSCGIESLSTRKDDALANRELAPHIE